MSGQIIIDVRYASGTYLAQVRGTPAYKCSCTGGMLLAAQSCAQKWYGRNAWVEPDPSLDRISSRAVYYTAYVMRKATS